ncbi:hypothetical protein C7455_101558 [Roseicyclus mahoneyensis]|uniref:Uncharacterized protein n=2 Tax=Roseicyclus mahoneyensis TaxID=164332 RepID=A0A316GMY1_9RHOB|nr:hypothetical protein C7455_101558 [Roseicyclus mahoneyensis]
MVPGHRTEDSFDEAALKVLSLALSEAALLALPRHVLQPGSHIRRTGLAELPDELMTGPHAPGLVLSPLLTPEFDALDLARILTQCGYRGRYLALVDRLPSANLIRREVAAQSPNINFDVIVLDGSTPLHSL